MLGDDDEDEPREIPEKSNAQPMQVKNTDTEAHAESDTDEEYLDNSAGGGYYDPRKPTGCSTECPGFKNAMAVSK